MKWYTAGKALFIIGLIHMIVYNWYFGWNWEPINQYEEYNDQVNSVIFFIGAMFWLRPFVEIYDDKVKSFYKNKIEEKKNLEKFYRGDG